MDGNPTKPHYDNDGNPTCWVLDAKQVRIRGVVLKVERYEVDGREFRDYRGPPLNYHDGKVNEDLRFIPTIRTLTQNDSGYANYLTKNQR